MTYTVHLPEGAKLQSFDDLEDAIQFAECEAQAQTADEAGRETRFTIMHDDAKVGHVYAKIISGYTPIGQTEPA